MTTAALSNQPILQQSESASASIYERIRDDIIQGRLTANARLKVSELADRMNTSTNPVREALQRLETQSMLTRDGRSLIVATLDHNQLAELYTVRTELEALAARGAERRFRAGTLIIQEGERGDTLYIVRSGRLRAFVADNSGKELTLGLYGPGEYVGEMSLDGGPRSASAATSAKVRTSLRFNGTM